MNQLISRSQRNCSAVEDFLAGNAPKLVLLLYSSEIARLEKSYPVVISKGHYVQETPTDYRHVCIIRRKSN